MPASIAALLGFALCVTGEILNSQKLPLDAILKSRGTKPSLSTRDVSAAQMAAADYVPYFVGFSCGFYQNLFNKTAVEANTWTAGSEDGTAAVNHTGVGPLSFPGFSYLDSTHQNAVLPIHPTHVIATSFKGAEQPTITGKRASTWFGLDSLYYTCVINTPSGFLAPADSCTIRFTGARYDGSVVTQESTVTPSKKSHNTYGPYDKVNFNDDFYALKTVSLSLVSATPAKGVLLALSDVVLGACAETVGGDPQSLAA